VPIYEYECDSCHFHFERKQSFDEEPVSACPKCKGKAKRVIHSIPVIFKGSGFYITDSRTDTDHEKSKQELPKKKESKKEVGKKEVGKKEESKKEEGKKE
jgi:putative FmdB family regulatory protein